MQDIPDTTCGGYGCDKGTGEIASIDYDFQRAYYSKEVNKFLFISEDSLSLFIYDVDTRATATLHFERTIHYVSLSPDGMVAALNVPGKLFYIDVVNDSILSQTYLPVLPGPLVIMHDKRVLALSRYQSLACSINPFTGDYFYSHSVCDGVVDAVLDPNQDNVYGKGTSESPFTVLRIYVTDSTIDFCNQAQYETQQTYDNRIWMFNEGGRIMMEFGRTYGVEGSDTVNFNLHANLPGVSNVTSFSQSSSLGVLAVIPFATQTLLDNTSGSSQVLIYNALTLSCVDTVLLPLIADTLDASITASDRIWYTRAAGQSVNFSLNSSLLYVVANMGGRKKAVIKVEL